MNPIFSGAGRCAPVRPRLSALTRTPLAWAVLASLASASQAQTTAAPATVVVTGNPLGSEALTQPSAVLAGAGLALRRTGTLGDTLDGLPGVAATGFGPQSSRPVIRGLDGDRIRLLDNGGASADASNLSFDHAVAVDPLVLERIEVLRGPAALLYGGNATGGVVNALDNRIPREALRGLGGRAEIRLGGAARETAAAALLEAGAGGLNWHADVAGRRSENQRTPAFSPMVDGTTGPEVREVTNSAGRSESGALGVSWADPHGFAGAAIDSHRNDYGVTVEPDVTIRMRRERLQLAGERRALGGWVSALSAQASHTRYQHEEVEGSGAVGTTFKSRGHELRLQATQAASSVLGGTLRGVLGLQSERLDFSALGDEAFVPGTQSRHQALFTLQSLALGAATLQAGVRLERATVDSDGDAPDAAEPRFGAAASRHFSPRSGSLGVVAPLGGAASGWQASASLGSTQRAPAYYELFANGLHVATGVYEQGNVDQQLERSRHLELGLQWQRGAHSLRAAVFSTRFANYIALDATGGSVTVDDEDGGSIDVPVYRFLGVPARLNGLEIEGRTRLATAPWQLDATASADAVRGTQRASGEPLPRIAPLRLQLGLEASQGAWRAGVQLKHAARQTRVPSTDVATPASTLVDLWASWQQRLGATADVLWFVKLGNLGNTLAYNASALRTARALSPAGARALQAGVRIGF